MSGKKYSPFKVSSKVHVDGVDGGGGALRCASVREEASADIKVQYAREVEYYRDLLATQETGLVFCRTTLLINPQGAYLHAWDTVALVALALTAVATPFEVSFVRFAASSLRASVEGSAARWFWFNRGVDAAFIVDMVQSFFIPFRDTRKGGRWVKNHRLICWNYVRGWFALDLTAAVPYDLLVTAMGAKTGLMKMLRLVRLIRIVRLGRIQLLLRRFVNRVTVNYAILALFQFAFFLLISVHWIACIWGMVASFQASDASSKPRFSWLDALELNKPSSCVHLESDAREATRLVYDADADALAEALAPQPLQCTSYDAVTDRYFPALYFAVYTLTGTGYGDVTPVNQVEYAACIICMMYSALLWAFMIGNFCAIVAGMDKHGAQFRQTMDDVNYMLRDRQLPPEMCKRVRTYFVKKRGLMRARNHRALERTMSSQLRGEVAAAKCGKWLDAIWYLTDSSMEFKRELSVCLEPILYAPLEPIDAPNALYVLTSGVAIRKSKVLTHGEIWGLDFLLPARTAHKWRGSKRRVVSVAITYVEVLMLSQAALNAILLDFPEELSRIRSASRWQVVRMALELWAMHAGEDEIEPPRSTTPSPAVAESGRKKPLERSADESATFSSRALTEISALSSVHSTMRADADDADAAEDPAARDAASTPPTRQRASSRGLVPTPHPGEAAKGAAALAAQLADLEKIVADQGSALAELRTLAASSLKRARAAAA